MAKARGEAKVSLEIQKFLKTIGCAVYSTEQGFRRDKGGTRQTPGIPDLIVIGIGPELPFFRVAHRWVPGFDLFRVPARWLLVQVSTTWRTTTSRSSAT